MTQQKLRRPIVACELGYLYNKEAIIERLLDSKANKDAANNDFIHIKSLKDVRELELTDNPAFKRDQRGKDASVGDGGYNDRLTSPYVCPIAGLEMNGKFKFVVDWTKGKVLSERGHKIVMKNDPEMKIQEENLVVLNPDDKDEAELMVLRMETRRAKAKAEKAAKKAKRKAATEGDEESGPSTSKAAKAVSNGGKTGTMKKNGGGRPAPEKSSATGRNGGNSSVQKDPSKSEVYKSLFSSHESALNKPKGNWVTFDPRYN